MRDYAQFRPRFWVSGTGKSFRGDPEAQLIAVYLFTSPHSNLIGLYYLPLSYIVNDTGLPFEGASKGLARVCEAGFAWYDADTEYVWVVNAAREQVGESLRAGDNRVRGVLNELERHRKCPFFRDFCEYYAEAFSLEVQACPQAPSKPLRSSLQAPSKPGTGTGTGDRTGSENPAREAPRDFSQTPPAGNSGPETGHMAELADVLASEQFAQNVRVPATLTRGQARDAAARVLAYARSQKKPFRDAATELTRAALAHSGATGQPIAFALLGAMPGSEGRRKPHRTGKPPRTIGTTAADFAGCEDEDVQLARLRGEL